MPATRQRTENWRKCLWQVYERGGALEISLSDQPHETASPRERADNESSHPSSGDGVANLIWRVKILGLNDREILVESPTALGTAMDLDDGIELIGAIVIGQNRWMFGTKILGHVQHKAGPHKMITALRLQMPLRVERCGRRNFYRVSMAELTLPRVRCWSLIDPASAAVAERANEEQVLAMLERARGPIESNDPNGPSSDAEAMFNEHMALPEVGPPFDATLANIGGGGIGLIVEPDAASSLTSSRLFWLQFALPPEIPAPLAATAKLVHTHIDSAQRTYAGLAFDFSRNRTHESFIVNQLTRYVELRQRAQTRRAA